MRSVNRHFFFISSPFQFQLKHGNYNSPILRRALSALVLILRRPTLPTRCPVARNKQMKTIIGDGPYVPVLFSSRIAQSKLPCPCIYVRVQTKINVSCWFPFPKKMSKRRCHRSEVHCNFQAYCNFESVSNSAVFALRQSLTMISSSIPVSPPVATAWTAPPLAIAVSVSPAGLSK